MTCITDFGIQSIKIKYEVESMRRFQKINLLAFAAALSIVSYAKGDDVMEKLKESANNVKAALTFKEDRTKNKDNSEYLKYTFDINTQTMQYSMQYKTFPGEDAKNNPAKLNDCSSGYGMNLPYPNWYTGGFINVSLMMPANGCNMSLIAGGPTILETSGKRVAYDITFKNASGCIVVRTVALAGKDELYIGVFGKTLVNSAGTMESTLSGYPLGFTAPHDRVVYGDNLEIKNGDARTRLNAVSWLLLSDKLKEKNNGGGLLGIIYDKNTMQGASVEIKDNYRVNVAFESPFNATEISKQYFIIFTFKKTTVPEAEKLLLEKNGVSVKAFENAFNGLPEPMM